MLVFSFPHCNYAVLPHCSSRKVTEWGQSIIWCCLNGLPNLQPISPTSKPAKPSPLGANLPLTHSDSTAALATTSTPADIHVEGDYNYPNWCSWPLGVSAALHKLDGMSDCLEWKECIAAWLEMEHRLVYQVSLVSISNILVFLWQLMSIQKKEHKLDTNGHPEEIIGGASQQTAVDITCTHMY